MCANKTCSSVFTIPAATLARRNRLSFLKAAIIVIEAFQEALALRRAAQRICFLGDE